MNFDFYIFGTPEKFELYPNKQRKIRDFKHFYDGSQENAKLVVQCSANGKVSYSYLRYNLFSHSGKVAFFGMSLEFKKKYCTDVTSLYDLFEEVYHKVILKNGILFKEVNGQTKFAVSSLKDTNTVKEMSNIKNIVERNINNVFSTDFTKIDDSFKQKTTNVLEKLDKDEGNTKILEAMKKYTVFSISPEYKKPSIASEPIQLQEQPKKNTKRIETTTENLKKSKEETKPTTESDTKETDKDKREMSKPLLQNLWILCATVTIIVLICLIIYIVVER